LTRDACAEDVGVVAVRHRGESAGLRDARLRKVVAVETEADHGLAAEGRRESAEGPAVLVPNGDGVARELQRARQLAAHPATPDDDDVQLRPPVPSGAGGC